MDGPSTPARALPRLRRLPPRTVWHAGLFAVLLAVGCATALVVDVPDVATLRGWLGARGPLGWGALLAGLSLATLAPVPRAALSALAGVLAGFWAGLALALASGFLGALAGFALARWLGREAVTRLAGPRLARADALLARRGALAVLTGRLVPVLPFTLVSYAGGLSGIRLRDYLAGSTIGLVPGTVLHVTIGATVTSAPDRPVLLLSLVPLALALAALAGGRAWHRTRVRRTC